MPTLAVCSSELTFPGSHNPGRTGPRAGTLPGFDAGHLIWLAVIVAGVAAIQTSRDSHEVGLGVGYHKKPRESPSGPPPRRPASQRDRRRWTAGGCGDLARLLVLKD